MDEQLRRSALRYHRYPSPGKLSITATKGLFLCEISIKDKLSSLKLSTAAEACFKTSCGSMQGPAEKLCFFIIILFFLSKLLFQYQF